MKTAKVVLTLVSLLLLCSCSNYSELSYFDIVAGIAVDKGEDGYELTIEALDLSVSPEENYMKSRTVKAKGETLPKALEGLRTQLSNRLHFSNMDVIIVSEEIARGEGLLHLLDWFTRDVDIRETINIVVSREATAAEVISAKGVDLDVASYTISHIADPPGPASAHTIFMPLYIITDTLKTDGKELVLPAVHLRRDAEEPTVELDGIAVFKDDKLRGFLDQEHVAGYAYLMKEIKTHEYVFTIEKQGIATLRVKDSSTKQEFTVHGGFPEFTVTVRLEGDINQLPPGTRAESGESMLELERLANENLIRELRETVDYIQKELQTDILWLGYDVYLHDEGLWNRLSENWSGVFCQMRIDIDADVTVLATGVTGAE